MLIIGASGHAHAVLSVLYRHPRYKPFGLIDSFKPSGSEAYGLPILGSEADVPELCDRHGLHHLLVAIGDNAQRQAMTERLQLQCREAVFPSLVDPTAVVANDAQLGSGVLVMCQAHVGSGCVLEAGSLLNTQASLDHDGYLEPYASLAPGAITGGHVHIGARSFIGLGARVVQKVRIGSDTVVGAGSLVLKDLPDGIVSYGAPAKAVRTRLPDAPYL